MRKLCRIKRCVKEEKGQAMLETALILPVLLLILIGIITCGMLLYSKIVVTLAASQSARLGATLYSKEEMQTSVADEKIRDMANSYLSGLASGSTINIEADEALDGEATGEEERQISVTVDHTFSLPLPFVDKILGSALVPLKYTAVYKIE